MVGLCNSQGSRPFVEALKDFKENLISHISQRLRELMQVRVRWGYRRSHVLLKREGFRLGVSQAYRWYCLEQLQLRAWRKKRRKSTVTRQAYAAAPGK